MFLTRIKQSVNAFKKPASRGDSLDDLREFQADTPAPARHVVIMQIVISLVLLIVGVFILTAPNFMFSNPFDESIQKIAAGWIGAVIGYWLS